MRKLLVYLNDFRKEAILGPLFKCLEAFFELMVPLVVASIIDRGIGSRDIGYIWTMCALMLALGVIGWCSAITAQYFAAKASAGFSKKVKHILFAHLQTLSYAEIDTLGTSTLITRMTSDMNQVQTGVNLTIRLVLRSPFIVIGAMIVAFAIDTKAAMIFVCVIPILLLIILTIMIKCVPLYRRIQEKLDSVLGLTRENLSGVRVIRAFCKEQDEIREFDKRHEELTAMQKYVGRVSTLINPLTYAVLNLGIVGLIWIGARRVDVGVVQQGNVVALYNLMTQILLELIKLASLVMTLNKSVACGNRIQDVLETKSSMQTNQTGADWVLGDTVVAFCNVDLRYQNAGANALTNINFAVQRGETIGILGGTGAGKSSVVQMIPRFYDASAGEVLVNGLNVKEYSLETLRAHIGIVPQKAALFQGSIRKNMQWGKKDATDDEIYEALRIAQVEEIADSKGGLDYHIEQGGKNLSGGQKQRFTIARALVRKPDILILDDSASALDYATDAALRRALRQMPNRPAVFIVSQRASSVLYADRIIVLDDGQVAGIGTAEELLQTCSVYQEIYASQFRKEG